MRAEDAELLARADRVIAELRALSAGPRGAWLSVELARLVPGAAEVAGARRVASGGGQAVSGRETSWMS